MNIEINVFSVPTAEEEKELTRCLVTEMKQEMNKLIETNVLNNLAKEITLFIEDREFIIWRDEYLVKFMGRWEYRDWPEKGNWSLEELYKKFKTNKS